jgi:hypothetical protein
LCVRLNLVRLNRVCLGLQECLRLRVRVQLLPMLGGAVQHGRHACEPIVVVAEGEAESEAVAVVANVDRGGHRRRRVVPQVQELR